jgi:hypothetical protein
MTKTDLLTGEKFFPKRRNQRFSVPANRIKYYNNRAAELRSQKSFVDRPLHVNYKILAELMKDKKEETFHKQFLLGKGYDFSKSTHAEKYQDNNHFALYCFIIIPYQNDLFKIVRK